jgi:di/tricarboxylate transporter
MTELPSIHAAGALLVTVITFILFAMGRIRIELICLGLIATLALGFYLFPFPQQGRYTGLEVAFGGFSHEALVAICSLMILGRGLLITGALEPVTHVLSRLWRFSAKLGLLSTLLMCFVLSMFVNDTPVLVLTLPILMSLAARSDTPASKSLMPANCAVLIGGMATTIGTSTNLLVVSIAQDLGEARIGLFDFTPIVLVAAAIALPYLWLVMPRLLPAIDNGAPAARRKYDAVLHLRQGSRALRKKVGALPGLLGPHVQITGVVRHGRLLADGPADGILDAADRILIKGTPEALREASEALKASLAEPGIIEHVQALATQERQDQRIGELVIGPESAMIGRSVNAARIADRYGVAVLGATRAESLGYRTSDAAETQELSTGDVLLVQGTAERLIALEVGEGALLLEGGLDLPHTAKAPVAMLIVCGVIALAASNTVPIAIAALAGTIAMLASGCIRFDSIGRALKLEVIVLVAASIALGRALVETGAAGWLASIFASVLRDLPPAAILASLMAFTTVLTNFVSNAAAAAVATPIAVTLSNALEMTAQPYILAVLFGCNLCYVTPMAYQTNLLIMSAARYRFGDFVRAGLPLALLMIVVLSWLLVNEYSL